MRSETTSAAEWPLRTPVDITTKGLLYLVCPTMLAVGLIWAPAVAIAALAAVFASVYSLLPAAQSSKLVAVCVAALLIGYAFGGRAFAHLGVRDVYVGEAVLALALLGCAANGALWLPMRSKLVWLLLAFGAWEACRTLPYVSLHGLDALRDAAIWGYGAFALVTAGVLTRRGSLQDVVVVYRRLILVYLTWTVFLGLARTLSLDQVAGFGDGDGSMLQVKPGDVAVHLAGIAGFMLVGLVRFTGVARNPAWLREWLVWPLWTAAFLLSASQTRGGLLSVLAALTVVFVLWPWGRWGKLAMLGLACALLFTILDVEIDLGATRKVSPQQIAQNLATITGGGEVSYDGTRRWRLSWWQTIFDYTLRGDYFWWGKGFGVNLADDDGFQVDAQHSLRSPHNGHLTVLARSGVPGFTLWILLQGGFCIALLCFYFRARRTGDRFRSALAVWLLAYWTAFTVNSSFDVYLEGPQGGIWFWAVFGVGIAVLSAGPALQSRQTRGHLPAANGLAPWKM